MILDETYGVLEGLAGKELDELTISDIRIGVYLTALRLSDGSTGTAATIIDEHPFCARSVRDFGSFTPLKIRGQRVRDLLEGDKKPGFSGTLKTAVLSALSARLFASGRYDLRWDLDPVKLVDPGRSSTVSIVGAFHSYIKKISATGCRLNVLEMNESALPPEYAHHYVPAGDYASVLPGSDLVIITGQALVNGTMEGLLGAVMEGTEVIVTGPSCSIIPDVLFRNKVTITGGTMISDPALLFDVVSEGGTGFHLFEYCARKFTIIKDNGA